MGDKGNSKKDSSGMFSPGTKPSGNEMKTVAKVAGGKVDSCGKK